MLTPTALYFEPDHVLSDMLQRLGVQTKSVQAPFEPETGAYQQHGGQSHSHDHPHHSSHDHSHSYNSHGGKDNHSHVHCDK